MRACFAPPCSAAASSPCSSAILLSAWPRVLGGVAGRAFWARARALSSLCTSFKVPERACGVARVCAVFPFPLAAASWVGGRAGGMGRWVAVALCPHAGMVGSFSSDAPAPSPPTAARMPHLPGLIQLPLQLPPPPQQLPPPRLGLLQCRKPAGRMMNGSWSWARVRVGVTNSATNGIGAGLG
jgi:hypothetical protein